MSVYSCGVPEVLDHLVLWRSRSVNDSLPAPWVNKVRRLSQLPVYRQIFFTFECKTIWTVSFNPSRTEKSMIWLSNHLKEIVLTQSPSHSLNKVWLTFCLLFLRLRIISLSYCTVFHGFNQNVLTSLLMISWLNPNEFIYFWPLVNFNSFQHCWENWLNWKIISLKIIFLIF